MSWFRDWTTSWGSHIPLLHRTDAQSQPSSTILERGEWESESTKTLQWRGSTGHRVTSYLLPFLGSFTNVTIFNIVHCPYCQYLSLAAVHFNYITFETKTFVGWGEPRNPLFFLPWHSQIFSKRRIKNCNNTTFLPTMNLFNPIIFHLFDFDCTSRLHLGINYLKQLKLVSTPPSDY